MESIWLSYVVQVSISDEQSSEQLYYMVPHNILVTAANVIFELTLSHVSFYQIANMGFMNVWLPDASDSCINVANVIALCMPERADAVPIRLKLIHIYYVKHHATRIMENATYHHSKKKDNAKDLFSYH